MGLNIANIQLHKERLVMIRSAFIENPILRRRLLKKLNKFLELAFKILLGFFFAQGFQEVGKVGFDHLKGRKIAAIQVHRCNNGLQRIGKNGTLFWPAGLQFSFPEQNMFAKIHGVGNNCQLLLIDHIGPDFCQVSFGQLRIFLHQ
jgi:hypothetical protein